MKEEKNDNLVTGTTCGFGCDINTAIFNDLKTELGKHMDEQEYIRYRFIDTIVTRGKESVARVAADLMSHPEVYSKYPAVRLIVTAKLEALDGEGNVI